MQRMLQEFQCPAAYDSRSILYIRTGYQLPTVQPSIWSSHLSSISISPEDAPPTLKSLAQLDIINKTQKIFQFDALQTHFIFSIVYVVMVIITDKRILCVHGQGGWLIDVVFNNRHVCNSLFEHTWQHSDSQICILPHKT